MRAVLKDFNNPPNTLVSPDCGESFAEVIDTTNPNHKDRISPTYYGAEDVRLKLSELYHNKCAYCETFDNEFQIEHYRPKKGVHGSNPRHPGYYWLCYEWSNLLPSCYDCNKPGSKGNYFDLRNGGVRATDFNKGDDLLLNSVMLFTNERPLLINPEEPGFDALDYFRFNRGLEIKEVAQVGSVNFERAKYTIDTIRLNREKLLRNERQNPVKELVLQFGDILALRHADKIPVESFRTLAKTYLDIIATRGQAERPYSFWWKYFLDNFNELFVLRFPMKFRPLLEEIYYRYKNGTL